ncbi:hypothetical protein Q8F55_006049 [Vanrija albida]|uniref:Uncharacterized protein n=1 Tax=Vanrija albida TaxID=181172 RepID=A0ABR3Q436_9TREE
MPPLTWPTEPCTLNINQEISQLQEALDKRGLRHCFKWWTSPNADKYENIKTWLDDITTDNLAAGLTCDQCSSIEGISACVHHVDVHSSMDNVEFYAYLMLRDNDSDSEEEEHSEMEKNAYVVRSMMCLLTVQFHQRRANGWRQERDDPAQSTKMVSMTYPQGGLPGTLLLKTETWRILHDLDNSKLLHKKYRWRENGKYEDVLDWLDDIMINKLYMPVTWVSNHEFYLYLLGRWHAGMETAKVYPGEGPGGEDVVYPPRDILETLQHLLVMQWYQYIHAGWAHVQDGRGGWRWVAPQPTNCSE